MVLNIYRGKAPMKWPIKNPARPAVNPRIPSVFTKPSWLHRIKLERRLDANAFHLNGLRTLDWFKEGLRVKTLALALNLV